MADEGVVGADEAAAATTTAAEADAAEAVMSADDNIDTEKEKQAQEQQQEQAEGEPKADDVEKAEGGGDAGSSDATKEVTSTADTCRACFLVFKTPGDLAAHEKTEHHGMARDGFRPSLGSYYCFLCWTGYNTERLLTEHRNSSEAHSDLAAKYAVKAVWKPPPKEKQKKKEPEKKSIKSRLGDIVEDDDDNSGDSKRKSIKSRLGDVVSDKNSPRGKREREEPTQPQSTVSAVYRCVDCNLGFVSRKSERLHRESQRHRAAAHQPRKRPYDSSGRHAAHCCYLCWVGFAAGADLADHYEMDEHAQRMKRYGVGCILKPPVVAKKRRRRSRSPDVAYINLADYIVLDEYKAEDDDSGVNGVGKDGAAPEQKQEAAEVSSAAPAGDNGSVANKDEPAAEVAPVPDDHDHHDVQGEHEEQLDYGPEPEEEPLAAAAAAEAAFAENEAEAAAS